MGLHYRWGGVMGEDGLEGIIVGPGTALGEGFASFQDYCRELARRGVILAACSKNDEADALEPFERHPEMVLRREDIASFVANWSDKATNLRLIANEIGIDLNSLVFIDDNPFERNLVRRELPMVSVPELDQDPATYANTIADAGYFESVAFTDADRQRTAHYQTNLARIALQPPAVDLDSYLRDLNMKLIWRRFDRLGLARITQLINKTNRFNLTTRRYTDVEVLDMMHDPAVIGLQLRLQDRFGDNGMIAIIIGRLRGNDDLLIDTWLMSCRVLGRRVERAMLNLVASEAARLGAQRLIGVYVPSKKNEMVLGHYKCLGFRSTDIDAAGRVRFVLDLDTFSPLQTDITLVADEEKP